MFCPKYASSVSDNAGADVATAKRRPSINVVLSIVAIIAAITIALFSLSGCGGSNTKAPDSSGSSSSSSAGSVSSKSVDDYTWEELSEISEEISKEATEEDAIEVAKKYNLVNSNGELDGTQTKAVQLTDGTTATVQIAGFLHDDKTDGGKAGITFIFKDAIAEHDMNPDRIDYINHGIDGSNAGGWEGSAMRSWLLTEGLSMLPSDLTNRIVAVDKKTNNVGETSSVASVTTTSDKLWLFSRTEICRLGKEKHDYEIGSAEGTEYKLFRDCNVGLNHDYQFLENGFNTQDGWWWLRSPDSGNEMNFYCVASEPDYGALLNMQCAYDICDVVPGFCI